MHGMLSGQREGRSRKVYLSTILWGLVCAVVNPVLFFYLQPESIFSIPVTIVTIVLSIALIVLSRMDSVSDRTFFTLTQWHFYYYTAQMVFHAFINDFHILHFTTALFSVQLCSLSFRDKVGVVIFNITTLFFLLLALILKDPMEAAQRYQLMLLSFFNFLCAQMLSTAKISIMAHMRLHRDVLQALSHKSEEALFIASMEGVILDLNKRALELFGYSRESLVFKDFKILRKQDLTSAEILEGLKNIRDNKFWTSDAVLITSKGEELSAYISIGKIERGEDQFLVYRVRDRRDEIRIQNDLLRARDEARAAADAKSKFVATVSHEIRTPLNGVIGMSNLLSNTKLDRKQSELVETIQKSGQSLMLLINDILDFSKTESGHVILNEEEVDIRELVHDIVALLSTHANGKGIYLQMNIDMSVPETVVLDVTRMKQVLLNLIGNAVKFTEKGGVTIHGCAKHRGASSYDLRFEVEDTGIGIPEDKVPNLFQTFFQVDDSSSRKYGGTGLGLAISKQLIELMGGGISVSSRFGIGTRFTIDLNVVAIEKIEKKSETNPFDLSKADFKGVQILIAEDNVINQKVIQYMLDMLGLQWNIVQNGQEALEYHKMHRPEIILMDVQMPILDGLEATRQIRQFDNDTFIIALTANHSELDKQRCLEAGMNHFISKPFVLEQLIDALQRASKLKT